MSGKWSIITVVNIYNDEAERRTLKSCDFIDLYRVVNKRTKNTILLCKGIVMARTHYEHWEQKVFMHQENI